MTAVSERRALPALVALMCVAACGAPQSRGTATTQSGVAIAVEVVQETTFAGGFQSDVAASLRENLLSSGVGVPVTDRSKADLVLRVNITRVNFSNATGWDWELVDPHTSAIVASKTETAALGRNAGPLASEVVAAVGALDLAPYAGKRGTAMVAAARPVEPARTMPSSTTDGSNAWAVVVGVEEYREKLPRATGAQADAAAFAEYATKTLNVPPGNIKVLVGERASRADLTGALTEWLPRNATKPGGRVYVFFSGHGAPDVNDGSAYLLPYDANPTYIKSSGFSVKSLQDQLAALNKQQAYVFIDACFSGVGDRTVLAEGTRPVVPVKEVAVVGSVVTFAAAGATQTTGASDDGQHGLFSFHLIAGLRGAADGDADGNIEVTELQSYVATKVQFDARRANREQTPTLATAGASAPLVVGLRR